MIDPSVRTVVLGVCGQQFQYEHRKISNHDSRHKGESLREDHFIDKQLVKQWLHKTKPHHNQTDQEVEEQKDIYAICERPQCFQYCNPIPDLIEHPQHSPSQ